MTDFINKLIAIFLIAIMLLVSPIVFMRQADRIQNEVKAVNAMELFLDTCADAHQLDYESYLRLVKTLESCAMTCDVTISTYQVAIANGETFIWKTGIIEDLTTPTELELGTIIELHVKEQTSTRAHDLWSRLFHTTAMTFDETFVKMIK